MGIKMSTAIFNGEEIKVTEYQEEMKNKIFCKYCNVPIIYVSGYIKEVGEKEIKVEPYFRLKNKENHHKLNCNYLTSNIIKRIYAKVADTGLMTKENNIYITRLHIITKQKRNKESEKSQLEINNYNIKNNKTKKYFKNGVCSAYLSTIKKIVKLKQALDNDNELCNIMVLQYYNTETETYDNINWNDFYIDYNLAQYKNTYEKIKNNNVKHPICFYGKIKDIAYISKHNFYSIKFYSLKESNDTFLSFSITTKNKDVYNYVLDKKDHNVIVYGCYHYVGKTNKVIQNDKKITYHNLSTSVNLKQQIFFLD